MSRAEKVRTLDLAKERIKRHAENKIDTLYPDVGPLRRELYPKHMEFFAAGLTYRERCAMCANRCLSPWTYVETPGGQGLASEVWSSGGANVLSWDDGSRCVQQSELGFLKGIEPTYRLVLDNGQFFDCSRKHHVLTIGGWVSLDRLMFGVSGLRWTHRPEDYQANCDVGGYLGDRPLRRVGGIDLERLPQRDDVQKRVPLIFERTDEVAQILQRIQTYQVPDHPATLDDLGRFAALFGLFSGPSSESPWLLPSENTQELSQLVGEVISDFPQDGEAAYNQFSFDRVLTPILDAGSKRRLAAWLARAGGLSLDATTLRRSVLELDSDVRRISIFYPFKHSPLIGGRTIQAVVPLGLQPIIDAHVPITNCYIAGGVVHHNTGKTEGMGGYETAVHLTGEYPDWWPGRRFSNPVSWWAAGKTNETTRDIVQTKLMGPMGRIGTGLIRARCIESWTRKAGVHDLMDTVLVKHLSGGLSVLGFKSYQQGRDSFEGTEQDGIWDDEEPPLDIYGEQLIRTATTNGMLLVTFTPLGGMSRVVMNFMPKEKRLDLE